MVKRTLLVAALLAGLAWWHWSGPDQAPAVVTAADAGPGAVLAGGVAGQAAGKAAPVRPAGGWPPRAWSVFGGKLVPGRALRERFDSYLPLGHGVTMVEVRAALERDAEADLGSANSAQVVAIWDRYARLQTYDWQHPFNGSDSRQWQATLNEQHQVRRQLLGADWAEAFFGEDEEAFLRRLAGQLALRPSGKPSLDEVLASAPTVSLTAPSASGTTATARSASVVAGASQPVAQGAQLASATNRDDWRAQRDRARLEWTHLSQDTTLDEGQRLIRIRQYLQQNFNGQDAEQVARDLQLP